jgi:hypothetical protein
MPQIVHDRSPRELREEGEGYGIVSLGQSARDVRRPPRIVERRTVVSQGASTFEPQLEKGFDRRRPIDEKPGIVSHPPHAAAIAIRFDREAVAVSIVACPQKATPALAT